MNRTTNPFSWTKTTKSRAERRRRSGAGRRSRSLGFEPLEERALMAVLVADALSGTADTTISGTVYEDLNRDGIKTAGENGVQGWTVYLDLDNSGTLNSDAAGTPEPSAITNVDGDYVIKYLKPGTYRVSEVVQGGWAATAPVSQDVAVQKSRDTTADFFNFAGGSIVGTVWNDLNADGVRNVDSASGAFTEPGLADWTVCLDLNNNRVADPGEPTTLTDASGAYSFISLPAGDYEVTEVLPSGWDVSPTFDSRQTVTVSAGSESMAADFANFTTLNGSIRGTIWNDINRNGMRDTSLSGAFTEPALAGWTVFVDSNSNGLLDAGEPQATSATDGAYSFSGILPGALSIIELATAGWRPTAPATRIHAITLKNGETMVGLDFGNQEIQDSTIRGVVFADLNKDGVQEATERGLAGITVYLDENNNSQLDAGEPQAVTSADLFFTPGLDEAGSYSFTHLARGTHTVRVIVPAILSATPAQELEHVVTIGAAEDRSGVDSALVFRPNEIHGAKFDDANGNHQQDAGESGVGGATMFLDLDRDNVLDPGEPSTLTLADGSYSFTNLSPGAYTVREILSADQERTYPTTVSGTLWPSGASNPAVGNVTPGSIETSLGAGESYRQQVSLTLPNTGALTNLVDVFLLFDDTGSFVNNSPIVRAAFPDIIASLQSSLPGIDLGFGVGRFEEYGNFAYEYGTGRPFILNQPIVAASTAGYMTAIQAALNRTTPGYGGDPPETDIEALYQLVTGVGFDGNNNGSRLDSGASGLAATQLNPGNSGDVPPFASFTADAAASVMPAAGTIGGAGFRAGALPIVLVATDTGFAYQPKGETSITGVGGLSLPVSALTQTSRPTTPFNYGAGLQETVTALNALGALVIGLGTNPEATLDPRQGLESLSKLTGAVNRTTTTIANGTADAVAPGDPFYFQIASGFGASVADGVANAIRNAVTNVAVNMTVQASDPRVKIINHTGVLNNVGAGQTATFDIEFVGDGVPHRFDLQFVREGTNVVLGSIPVVIGTPIPGNGYEFEYLEDGEIGTSVDFGSRLVSTSVANAAPAFTAGANQSVQEDAAAQAVVGWATSISPGPASEAGQSVNFLVSSDAPGLFSIQPAIAADGTLTYTPAPNAFGVATVTVQLHDDGGTANGGADTSAAQAFTITINPVNDAPVATNDSYSTNEDVPLVVSAAGVLGNDTDVDSAALTAVLVTGPAHGTVTLNADGSFRYVPAVGFAGTDQFRYHANDGLLDGSDATVAITVNPIAPSTKFLVVDYSSDGVYQYDAAGHSVGRQSLKREDNRPRGIASNKDGSLRWVVDSRGKVFVYDQAGKLAGAWQARGIVKPEGIATDGTNLWIVDGAIRTVFYFAGAASRRPGEMRYTSRFLLT